MKRIVHRGSALLAALVVIGVVALITAATLQLAGMHRAQAAKDARWLSKTACADAARQYILGRLRFYNLDPTTIVLDQAIQLESGTGRIRTGHIGGPAVTSITSGGIGIGGSQQRVRNMTNTIGRSTLSAKPYNAVVTCSDPVAGDMELEFTFKFGL